MNTTLHSRPELDAFTAGHPAALVYFSAPGCHVCQVLRPKLEALLAEAFPRIATAHVDCGENRELAAQMGVLSIPTLVVWLDGREFLRKVRNFSLGELREELARPYGLFFEE